MIEGGTEIQTILLNLFNRIWLQEDIPKAWSIAQLVCLFKGKGDPERINNYRGISLSSNMGKLFERIVNSRMVKIVNFTEAHAGGRSKYSTVDQLYVLKSLIQKAVANKTKLYIAYIDLEKTYDRAWKQIIFHTMWKAGVKGKIWRIVGKLNEGLKTVVKTCHGLTRKVKIPESIRQGGASVCLNLQR